MIKYNVFFETIQGEVVMQTTNMSNELMFEIHENVPAIIAFHDTEQRIVWANKAYRQALDVCLDDLGKHTCYHLWGLRKGCRNCPVTKALTTGESAEADLTPDTQDDWPEDQGSWLVRAVPIRDQSGRIVGAVETAFEITERKKAEQERLRESEERYRSIFEQARDGIFLMDRYGSIIDCNPAACSMLGYQKEELVKKNFTAFISSESLVEQPFQGEVVSKGQDDRIERQMLCKGGKRRTMEESIVELHTGDLLVMLRDITERKQMEHELAKERRLLQTIVDNIPVMISHYDPDSNMLYLNKEFEQVVGWTTEEVQHIDMMKQVYPDPEYRRQVWEYMKLATSEWREFSVRSKHGDVIASEWSNIVLEDGTHVGIGIDVRERKRAEEELRQSRNLLAEAERLADVGAWSWNLEKDSWSFSEHWLRLHGCNEPPRTSEELLKIAHPEDQPRVRDAFRKNLVGKTRYDIEHRIVRQDNGEVRHVQGVAEVITNAGGEAVRMIGAAKDVTRRKRDEQALNESLRQLSTLMGNLPGMAYRCRNDPCWTMFFVSGGCFELTGYQSEDLIENHRVAYADLIRKEDRNRILNDMQKMILQDGIFEVEYRIVAADGKEKYVLEKGTGVYDGERLLFLEGFVTDITEQKLAEKRVRQLNRILHAIRSVNQIITEETNRKRLIQKAVDTLVELQGCEKAWIALLSDNENLAAVAEAGQSPVFSGCMCRRDRMPFCGWMALKNSEVIVVQDLARSCMCHRAGDEQASHNDMAVPLKHGRKVYGVLFLTLPLDLAPEKEEKSLILEMARDIAFCLNSIDLEEIRVHHESEREINLKLLHMLHRFSSVSDLLSGVISQLREWSDCEAVGIRLQQGDDFPYYETRGFPEEHLRLENSLCEIDWQGRVSRDFQGNPVLECMCGNVIKGNIDASLPFFTEYGSFWTNSTTDLLASTSEADRQARTRNRCHGEGYESVALIPLRHGEQTLGLLQFNDSQRNQFSEQKIRVLEGLAENLALGLMHRQTELALRESEQSFRQLFEQAAIGIFIVSHDHAIIEANQTALNILGYSREEALHLSGEDIVHPKDLERYSVQTAAKKLLSGEEVNIERRFRLKGGRYIHVLVSLARMPYYSEQAAYMVMFQDISERKRIEEDLRRSENYYRTIFETSGAATVILEEDHRIILANSQAEKLSGYSRRELQGMKESDFIHSEDLDRMMEFHWLRREDPSAAPREYSFRLVNRSGNVHLISCTVDLIPGTTQSVVSFIDLTETKKLEEQLRLMSLYDSLTGLYNRNFFDLEMERLSDQRYVPVGIVVCDLDGLKFINDTLGHSSGDDMLVNAANILKQCIRSSEIIARVGGDEFAILLPEIDEAVMHGLIQRLRREVDHFNARNPAIPVSLSIGYAVGSAEGTDMEVLFREADNRMYREKIQKSQSSRNAIVQGLIKAVEARDFITEGHSERLQELVALLARAIDLSEDRINDLCLFARFHDLGKVGIHDNILFKPETLTEDEFREMQKHSEVGYRIAQSLHDMAPIADWILKHHERWDGLGYPFGLQDRDIPLECRILAIADAFDVMTSDRPYQNAVSSYEAVQELRRCAGTQFDPDLVKQFIHILDLNDTG